MSHLSPTEYNIKDDPNHRIVSVAATQMSCSGSIEENIKKAVKMVRDAAKAGANVILLQELKCKTDAFPYEYFEELG
jgi:predicted amidohydrolase